MTDVPARVLLTQQRQKHMEPSTHLAQHDYKIYAAAQHAEGDRAGRLLAKLISAERSHKVLTAIRHSLRHTVFRQADINQVFTDYYAALYAAPPTPS